MNAMIIMIFNLGSVLGIRIWDPNLECRKTYLKMNVMMIIMIYLVAANRGLVGDIFALVNM